MLVDVVSGCLTCQLCMLEEWGMPDGHPEELHGLGVDRMNGCIVWSKALQRPLRAASAMKVLENTTGWLGRLCWHPARMTRLLPSLPTSLHHTQPSSSAQPCACQQALLFWALIETLTPMSKHRTAHEVWSSGLLLTDNRRDVSIYFGASFNPLFCFKPCFRFWVSFFPLAVLKGKPNHLHALTNPVHHLLLFYFLNNCKFLNLGLGQKTGPASSFLHICTAASMDRLPAASAKNSPIRSSVLQCPFCHHCQSWCRDPCRVYLWM